MDKIIDDIPQEWESVARELFLARFEAMRHYRAIKETEHLHPSKTKHLLCHGRSNPIYSFSPENMDPAWMDESYDLLDAYATRIQHHLRLMKYYFEKVKEKDEWLRKHHYEYWKKLNNEEQAKKFKKLFSVTKKENSPNPNDSSSLDSNIIPVETSSKDHNAPVDSKSTGRNIPSRICFPKKSQKFEKMIQAIREYDQECKLKHLNHRLIFVVKHMGKLYTY